MATNNNNNDGAPSRYYDEPFTLEDMDDQVHRGLMAIGSLAALSVIFTTALLSFITWRMISVSSQHPLLTSQSSSFS